MLEGRDVEQAVSLFSDIIDERYKDSADFDLRHFKKIYTPPDVKTRLGRPECVYLVGKMGSEVVCFIFGWAREEIGHLYWLGVKTGHRGKGYGTMLIERAVAEFEKRDCHEAKFFTSQRVGLRLFEKCGFKDITYINKLFFGVNLVQMVKKLKAFSDDGQTKKIIISGEAGQGIKLITHALGSILNKLGKEVALDLTYDARVIGGNITAKLIYSNKKIESPFFKEADIAIQLSKKPDRSIVAKKMVFEELAGEIDDGIDDNRAMESLRAPFEHTANEQFRSSVFVNMIALGNLLKYIGVDIEHINFPAEFPARFLNENITAVKYGYTHRDWK